MTWRAMHGIHARQRSSTMPINTSMCTVMMLKSTIVAMKWPSRILYDFWQGEHKRAHHVQRNYSPIRAAIFWSTWRDMVATGFWNFKIQKRSPTMNWPMHLNKCGKNRGMHVCRWVLPLVCGTVAFFLSSLYSQVQWDFLHDRHMPGGFNVWEILFAEYFGGSQQFSRRRFTFGKCESLCIQSPHFGKLKIVIFFVASRWSSNRCVYHRSLHVLCIGIFGTGRAE